MLMNLLNVLINSINYVCHHRPKDIFHVDFSIAHTEPSERTPLLMSYFILDKLNVKVWYWYCRRCIILFYHVIFVINTIDKLIITVRLWFCGKWHRLQHIWTWGYDNFHYVNLPQYPISKSCSLWYRMGYRVPPSLANASKSGTRTKTFPKSH